jgi:hypothetical protein
MAIIPFPRDRHVLRLYECPRCRETFIGAPSIFEQPLGAQTPKCAVDHAPGTCCHYGERLVPRETVREVLALLERESRPAPPEED